MTASFDFERLRRVGGVRLLGPVDRPRAALRRAARLAAGQLTALHIPHVMNVAPHRVQFVVGVEAFELNGAVASFKPGVPVLVGDVPIEYFTDCVAQS